MVSTAGPLSFAEELFWTAYLLEDHSPAYHIPLVLRLEGRLDLPSLEAALGVVVNRHDILRTRYPMGAEGEPFAVVDEPAKIVLTPVEVSGEPEGFLARAALEPFDLETGPLIRWHLCRTAAEEHYLQLTLHHIVTDGWSTANLYRELTEAYAALACGEEPKLPELTVQYRDHALWQRDQRERFERQLDYWEKALAGVPRGVTLPADRPRYHRSHVPAGHFALSLPKAALLGLARTSNVTLFMVLVAAYAVVLSRRSGETQVVLGTPVAGRRTVQSEQLIGCFINTLAVRTELSGDPTFSQLLHQVRDRMLDAYDNQDVPFKHVTDRLASGSHDPFFRVWLALLNTDEPTLELPGLLVEQLPANTDMTKFDVSFYVCEEDDDLVLEVVYATSLFHESTVRAIADDFAALLVAAVAEPGRRISGLVP
ncbi:condensation domain-containing protein [Microbispora amethystogenes]|uniref:condensation domain-containing protein n=1 Tax=Microbispora amethystogenes TaxID=1427754 RepID=UPI0033FABDB1